MTSSPGNLLVRAIYLATVIFGLTLVLFIAVFSLSDAFAGATRDWLTIISWLLVMTILCVLPCVRALWRVFASGTVIPPELVNERPVVAWVVSLAGSAGHFFFVISMSAAIDLALLPEWPDDIGGLGFVFGLALLSYLIALLCGELALVGNGVSDEARALRSGPFS
jgi:hypothetical protein